MTEPLLATTFRFRVDLRLSPGTGAPDAPQVLGHGGFQECSGLEIEMGVDGFTEGGRNDAVVQRAGRATFPRLVLKRGMVHPPEGTVDPVMWFWLQDVIGGIRPVRRYSGTVAMHGEAGSVRATWAFDRALPAKIVGPQLNARTGEVAVEEIHLAHEGLRLR